VNTDSGVDELAEAVSRLLADEPWETRRIWLDEAVDLLLSDAADGRLAVIWQGFNHDRRFQLAIEQIRIALDEARDRGRDDRDQPLSKYLASAYLPPGPLAEYRDPLPVPPEVAQLGPTERRLVFVSLALFRARAWETRRRILLAFPTLLVSGDIEHTLQALGSSVPRWKSPLQVLLNMLLDARERGIDVALRNRHETVFFTTIPNRQQPVLTEVEARQFALLAYLGAPSWPRRRRLLLEHRDLLLSERVDAIFELLTERCPPGTSTISDAIPAAREVLQGARLNGIEAAFDGAPLPPTRFRLTRWDVQAAPQSSDAEQISHLRELVLFLDPDLAPWSWAQANIALVRLLAMARGEAVQTVYLEEALLRVQDALEVITANEPDEWRVAQQLLGRVLSHRLRGDPATNQENAINALKAAIEALPPQGHAEEAMTLSISLGQAYLQLPKGVRAVNLETAAAYLKQAICEPARQHAPVDWALAKVTLGQVCEERLFGDRQANFDYAMRHLEDALSVAELKEQEPRVWASAHLTLASIHARGRVGEPRAELNAALKHAELAMTVFTREDDPRLWAATRSTCAAALFRRAADDVSARATAQEHLLAALEIFDGKLYPTDRRHVLKDLGGIAFYERRWQAASEIFEEVKSLNELLEEQFCRTDAGRVAEISEMGPVYERLAWCHLKLGDHERALQVLDAGKTRQLRRALAIDDFGETGERQLGAWQQLLALVPPDGGLVSFVITTQGAAAYVLGPDGPRHPNDGIVVLDDGTDRTLREILDGTGERIGWLKAYADWLDARNALETASVPTPELEEDLKKAYNIWVAVIARGCGRLWGVLFEPVYRRLRNLGVSEGGTLAILPSRLLFVLPLAAAWRYTPNGRRYLIDDFAIAIAPSATAAAASRARTGLTSETTPNLAMVIDPTGDLPWTVRERAALKEQFPNAEPIDPPTVERVIDAAATHTYLHLACHGQFNWVDPMGSGLTLSDELLTARAIATASLPRTRLVSLSACETGLVDTEHLEYEYVGLAGAFLHAGAAGILSSLWTVEDESTAALMSEFYAQHVRGHAEPASALRSAQLTVRKRKKFDEPFYWAAFQLVGT
jgi:tetratricopeptide (TPR) repeat protein